MYDPDPFEFKSRLSSLDVWISSSTVSHDKRWVGDQMKIDDGKSGVPIVVLGVQRYI
jgi:hypothetical protein